MYEQSQIDNLKKKSIVAYLDSIGMKPTKMTHGKVIRYISPFRQEKEGSFYVYPQTGTWYDFGAGKGGSIIQLVMECEKVSFGKACEILSEGKFKEREPLPPRSQEPAIRILYTSDITSEWLRQYITKRAIDLEVAKKYLRQARIELKRDDNTPYRKTVLAFENDKKGFEFRNSKSKLGNSPKYLTTINKGKKNLLLFEGAFDWLSFVTLYGEPHDKTIIVLNSVSFISYIDFKLFDSCDFYCDNDDSGSRTLEVVKAQVPTKDMRNTFYPQKDLNEWIMKKRERGLYKRELLQML